MVSVVMINSSLREKSLLYFTSDTKIHFGKNEIKVRFTISASCKSDLFSVI
jgi:hypothetical protein